MNCTACGTTVWVTPTNGKCPACFAASGEEAWQPQPQIYSESKRTLSRRDHFAMAAMQGLLASGSYPSRATLYDVRDAALASANMMIKVLDGGDDE